MNNKRLGISDDLVDSVRAVLSGEPNTTQEDIERRADAKMVKVRLPDGRIVFRRERPKIEIGKGKNEAMDPVDPKALKGKHKDRKDKDIDNDGDVDSSDKYLHKRRQAVSKAVVKEEMKKFEKSSFSTTKQMHAIRKHPAFRDHVADQHPDSKYGVEKHDTGITIHNHRNGNSADFSISKHGKIFGTTTRKRVRKDGQEYHHIVKNTGEHLGEGKGYLDEGKFSPKEIKMAIGIASDPRYKQGNYSGAVRAIEKIKKGLASHPQVAAVLKRQNEEVELDEGKFSPKDWIKDSAAVKASKDPKFVSKMIDKWGQRGGAWLNHPALSSKKKSVKEEAKSPLQKLRDFDKSRQAVGKKPIFKDKPKTFVKMKKPGSMTTMNVPSNEVGRYEKNGYRRTANEEVEHILEGGNFKSKADAMAAAAASYAKQRDPSDEIEVWQMSRNKFEINHPMNSSGRNSIKKSGGKLIGVVGKKVKKEAVEDNPANTQHLCAKNVVHESWGEGICIPTMHADPDDEGNIEWYDIMFDHGIEEHVSVDSLDIILAEAHTHKKPVKENDDEDDDDEDDDDDDDNGKKKKGKKDDVDTKPSMKDVSMVSEKEMSPSQTKKREEIVKSMKKKMPDFKKKYGDRAKDVMYATATKMAMKEGFELSEETFHEIF